jgi:hypothetical protein
VIEPAMPSMKRQPSEFKSLSCTRNWQRVETLVAPSFKKKLPCGLILCKKEIRMVLKKDIVIGSKAMNKNKILFGLWNMEHMIKLKIMILGMNSSLTNMTNAHTCIICDMDLFTTIVLLLESQLL